MPMFQSIVEGYLAAAHGFLTQAEIDQLAFSGKLITLEIGIRFLTDYLEGDQYFKVSRPDHNLIRCRTQLKLVECIEQELPSMEQYVKRVRMSENRVGALPPSFPFSPGRLCRPLLFILFEHCGDFHNPETFHAIATDHV